MDIKETIDILLEDRIGSWPFIVVLYLIVTLVIRRITFSQMRVAIKCLDKKIFRRAKRAYHKESLSGWLFYLVSVVVLVAFWLKGFIPFLRSIPDMVYLTVFFFLFLFSIISHLKALFFGTIQAVREKFEKCEVERARIDQS